jgi:hypothetical protein
LERVIGYIDGFNLYHGIVAAGWRRYLWLDLPALMASLLRPDQTLSLTKYCTARVSSPPSRVRRQATYIDALQARGGIEVLEGKFQPRDGSCRRCGHTWPDFEEKQTDVNIAVEMMKDAHLDNFDMALLVCGDADITPAVIAVQALHPGKRVVVAHPPKRRSDVLNLAASGSFGIGRRKLAGSQLPDQVTTATGHILHRPQRWT